MKVTRNLPEQLILEDRPWFTGLAIGGMFLVFTGLGLAALLDGEAGGLLFFVGSALAAAAFWAFVRRVQIILDRSSGTIEVRRKWIGGASREVHPLDGLRGAEVETRRPSEPGAGKRGTHRAILVFSTGQDPGRLPLTEYFSGGSSAQRCAEAVNQWLDSGRAAT